MSHATHASTYFQFLDSMLAGLPPDEGRKLLRDNIATWEQRAAALDAWGARGGRGKPPLPGDWNAFDVAAIRNGLAARKRALTTGEAA